MADTKIDDLPEEYRSYFRDCGRLPAYEQAKVWLKAYFRDADVDISEVYGIAKSFRTYLNNPDDTELEENQAMKFLEKRGETMTPIALRKKLREYDIDRNNKMSLLEYLMMRYQKTVKHFVENDVDGDPTLIAARNAATAECNKIQAEIDALHARNTELEGVVAKGGVAKFGAQQEIADNTGKKIPELGHQLEKARKVEAKAIKAVEDYGSDLDRMIQELGLPEAD
jgi:hypothetical protein